MNPAQFVEKWKGTALPERAASHEHFLDLCALLGQPSPASVDKTGAEYAFEKGVAVTGPASSGSKGQSGFADVWWRSKFGWEYKRKDKHKSLAEAYQQLLKYREALENPPLLIVCDISRIEIHTNFTGTAKQVHKIALADLPDPSSIDLLRRVFTDPLSFRPHQTAEDITRDVAREFAQLAASIRERGDEPHDIAHFLMKCMFCLFAEDVELLPKKLFEKTLRQWKDEPARLVPVLQSLFTAMQKGGAFGADPIDWFNGGLFDDSTPIELTQDEIGVLLLAANRDWSQVRPEIFGTLFERSLDPEKRSQIGAHYTSYDDIMLIVEPVVMHLLRDEWTSVQRTVEKQLERRRKAKTKETKDKADSAIAAALDDFMNRLASVRVLDPACGSGNFLYVAIQQLLDLEKEVITFAARPEIGGGLLPNVRPTQLHGIEINPYAAELAQVVIWIGYLQWMRDNGFNMPRDPVLEPIQTIERRDAILRWRDEAGTEKPAYEEGATCLGVAHWPEAEFIIGNPPFLGSKLFRKWGLPDPYIEAMYQRYELPNTSDLCCYWFERARQVIEKSRKEGTPRVGLLATQGIRGGSNRETLRRIKGTGDIFMAWSDRPWVLDGAAVHVSIVGFDGGEEQERSLDGAAVEAVNANLGGAVDIGAAERLGENIGIAFMGDTKGGPFDIDLHVAAEMLEQPNPKKATNADVLRPWVNGGDITKRARGQWIIDFGCEMGQDSAALYHAPFAYIEEHVKPMRANNRRKAYAERWWIHVEPRPAMRDALPTDRYIATPNLTKHRIVRFLDGHVLPDHQLIAFARSDDYFFGVLHSSIHELYARRTGTQLREVESGFRYTPTTCFETFPLPWPPGKEDVKHPAYQRIAEAARELNEQRERWLNPPEWLDPIAKTIDVLHDFSDVPEEARPLIRESAIQAQAAKDLRIKKRTLTNLYNERPTWLQNAHEKLDRAVLAAYAATNPAGDWSEDWAEVWRETGAGQPPREDASEEAKARRAEVEEMVLANLLRLNQERAAKESRGA